LGEDDLDLIEENTGLKVNRQLKKKKRFKRLKRISAEDISQQININIDQQQTDLEKKRVEQELFGGEESDDDLVKELEGSQDSQASGEEDSLSVSEEDEMSNFIVNTVDGSGEPIKKQGEKDTRDKE